MTRELGDRMVADERFKLLTFTGSPSVGWRMKERAGKKKVVLELGGNAGVIVDKTRRPRLGGQAHPRRRLRLCRPGLHQRPAGVHPRGRLGRVHGRSSSTGAAALKVGDPLDPTTDLGPMVDEHAAARTQRWVDEAVALGGKVARRRHGRRHVLPADDPDRRPADGPGLLERGVRAARRGRPVPRRSTRPSRWSTTRCSGSRPASSPTTSPGAWRAFGELEVGGVIINDIPTYRIDHMPYGGVKDSGLGREGLRYAIEDMTEIRIMVLAQPS